QPLDGEGERMTLNPRQRRFEGWHGLLRHVPEEVEREVHLLRRRPPRAGHVSLQRGEGLAHRRGRVEGDEEAHGGLRSVDCGLRNESVRSLSLCPPFSLSPFPPFTKAGAWCGGGGRGRTARRRAPSGCPRGAPGGGGPGGRRSRPAGGTARRGGTRGGPPPGAPRPRRSAPRAAR